MQNKKPKNTYTRSEAKLKAASYCAYQERSQEEVRSKLYDLGLYSDDVEDLISELITENFINEERFAKAYVGGKFRIKKWGRRKIALGLKQHNLSRYCVQKGMEEIDTEEYFEVLTKHILKKMDASTETDLFKKRNKIANFAIAKGFESELVWEVIKDHF